jgi:hypothetical protein
MLSGGALGMPEYRFYAITGGERPYLGPRKVVQCADDKAAIKAAEQWMKEHEVEVWEPAASLHG